jgi:hypothetical protein
LYGRCGRSGQELRNCPAQIFDTEGLSQDRIHLLVRICELFQIGGNHQNRQGRGNLPDLESDLAALHSRHEVVQDHQIKGLALYPFNRLHAFGGFNHLMPVNAEQQFD